MIDYKNIEIDSFNLPSNIKERLKLLLTTRVGTVVLDRDFGLKMEFIDKPLPIAKQLYTIDVIQKIKKYEPDLKIQSVTFKFDTAEITKLIPVIKITAA